MDPDYPVFVRIVEAGSLSAAARELSISPAMVSKRLARLEARLGVRLLHRSTRRLSLTEAGGRFHVDIAAVLRAARDAEHRLTGFRDEPAGFVRLSAPTSFGRLHVVPHLHELLLRYPRIGLEVDLTDGYVDLFAGRFDLAIRIAASIPASLEAHRLGDSRRILCASPDYLARHGTPHGIAALSRHRLLAAAGQLPWRLVNGRSRHTVEGESHVRTNSSEVVRELAAAGVGIAFRSLWDVGALLTQGALIPVLPGWEGASDVGIFVVQPGGPAPPPAVRAAVDFLRLRLDPARWDMRVAA